MSWARTILVALAAGLLAVSIMARADQTEPRLVQPEGLLIDVHNAVGLACSACHNRLPPEPRPGFASCVTCHGTMLDWEQVMPAAAPDPHHSPHLGRDETPECTSCHRVHRPSEVSCTMCHRAFRFDIR